jgi:cytochrome b561
MANQAHHHDRAYGATTRALHWVTVLALLGQFTIGYLLDVDDPGRGRGRGRGRGGESGRGRGRGGDDDPVLDVGWNLLTAHVSLGVLIVLLAALRVAWRRVAGLPPWADSLTEGGRLLASATERALLTLLFVVPLTGLALVLGDDDLLWLHVTAHIAFFVALAAHVGVVLRRGLLPRML